MSVKVEHNWDAQQWDWPLQHNDGVVKVHNDKHKFEVALDAQHFTPSEIQVKVVGNVLDIHFEHQSRPDSLGALPDDVDATTVKSTLSTRGTLVITANKKA
ncbi:hypothetical protein PRIPAC_95286 [Pristionchus pacificus]|uniref:SHSP domain-containing protein n=1 Tax=Pristionchus pacificus TaxID=54126 RepID=A0A2A6BIP9_PRIPA|nr:hypothetical protein PRIPAC_95286 [Pristionchus pacificus]|eukprot:PDM65780.1 hypothetical protein PRIPAC_45181 [Pristionchus pacificus]